jgi:hypothetical protein
MMRKLKLFHFLSCNTVNIGETFNPLNSIECICILVNDYIVIPELDNLYKEEDEENISQIVLTKKLKNFQP